MSDLALFLLALAVVWLAGASLLSLLGLRRRCWPLAYIQPAVDFAIGGFLLATIWVVAALVGAGVSRWVVYAVAGALAASAAVTGWRRRGRGRPAEQAPPMPRSHLALTVALLVLLAVATIGAGDLSFRTRAFWDGRYIWGFKAKAMYLDGKVNKQTFTSAARYLYMAPHHPIGLPALEAWVYQNLGRVDERYGKLIGIAYWLGIAAALAAYLRRRTCWPIALAVSLLVAQAPQMVYHAGSGAADVPLAFCFLAAGLVLGDWFERGRREDGVMAALLLGSAGTIKPEAMTMCLGAGVVFCMGWWRGGERRWTQLALPLLCLALPWLPWLALRWQWGMATVQGPQMAVKGWEEMVPRLVAVWGSLSAQVGVWPTWEVCWGFIALGLAAHLACRPRQAATSVLWALALWQSGAYVTVYLLSVHYIYWTLASSLDRLLIHLMPLALAAACGSLMRERGQRRPW